MHMTMQIAIVINTNSKIVSKYEQKAAKMSYEHV